MSEFKKIDNIKLIEDDVVTYREVIKENDTDGLRFHYHMKFVNQDELPTEVSDYLSNIQYP